MADKQPTAGDAAVDAAAAAVSKLHLDEVTGEMISKTELKKRQKAREKDAQKKEKDAANKDKKPAQAAGKKNAEASEKELTPNQVCLSIESCRATIEFSGFFLLTRHIHVVLRDSIKSRQRAPRPGQGLPPQGALVLIPTNNLLIAHQSHSSMLPMTSASSPRSSPTSRTASPTQPRRLLWLAESTSSDQPAASCSSTISAPRCVYTLEYLHMSRSSSLTAF